MQFLWISTQYGFYNIYCTYILCFCFWRDNVQVWNIFAWDFLYKMCLLKRVYCFCIKDLENRKVNTLTEVKSHLTVKSLHSFGARDTSWHVAEQIIKHLLQCQQCSDLICDLRLSSHLEERGTVAELQQGAHQQAERLLRCQRFWYVS